MNTQYALSPDLARYGTPVPGALLPAAVCLRGIAVPYSCRNPGHDKAVPRFAGSFSELRDEVPASSIRPSNRSSDANSSEWSKLLLRDGRRRKRLAQAKLNQTQTERGN
jgi:hypothetical protein